MSTHLPVAVAVDPATGRWSVDGVPMVLVPQHLLTGVLTTAEERAGTAGVVDGVHAAGYLAARQWCEHQAAHLGLAGADLVRHYLDQLSRRGWGRFTVDEIDLAARHVDVRVDHSVFAARRPAASSGGACYPFAAWLEGAVDYAADPTAAPGSGPRVTESECAADGAGHCRFRSLPERANPTVTKG